MVVVLDSESIDPRDRADVMEDVIQKSSAPSWIKPGSPGEAIQGRYETWEFGAVSLTRVWLTGLSVVRTPRQIRVSPSPVVQVVLKDRGRVRYSLGDTQYEAGPDRMFLFDLNLPFAVEWSHGAETILAVPLELLALPSTTIGQALDQLPGSPLYPLVANQISTMVALADGLEADLAAAELGTACVDMVRALMNSAATLGSDDVGAAIPAHVLLTQVREYVRRNITDPDLDAARIARAHHVSLRFLYKVCANAGMSLAQWIIRERLERARAELARPQTRHWTIAVVAQRCGFRDAAHFTRRFRAAYGVTPSDWRRMMSEPGE